MVAYIVLGRLESDLELAPGRRIGALTTTLSLEAPRRIAAAAVVTTATHAGVSLPDDLAGEALVSKFDSA